MKPFPGSPTHIVLVIALTLTVASAWAQHHEASKPQPDTHAAAPATADTRVGDPYPLDTCPITGKKLGDMGDPVVKVYQGREVRFCCSGCPKKFEKDYAAGFGRIDEQILKDQGPIYPLKISLVTGKDLPEKPFEFVWGNRLIRLGAEAEQADFLQDPKKYFKTLNEAVIAEQGAAYPVAVCLSSGDDLGEMGEVKDVVLAGRLIRLCCNDCRKDLEENPAKFIAIIDGYRNGEPHNNDANDDKHIDADQPPKKK